MFDQIFLSPHVKRTWLLAANMVYTSYLTNFRTTQAVDLRKLGNIKKILKLRKIIGYCSVILPKYIFFQYWQKTPEKQKLNFSRSALFHMKTRNCLKHFVHDCRSRIPDAWSVVITCPLKVTFHLAKTEHGTKETLTQLSHYYFE